jgi:hypothetical protein
LPRPEEKISSHGLTFIEPRTFGEIRGRSEEKGRSREIEDL